MSRLAALLIVAFTIAAPAAPVLDAAAAHADARADCCAKSGDAAIRACTAAIARDPSDVPSYISRAFELQQKGEYARSLEDYAKAIAIDPARWDAYQGRAWANLKLGKPAEALSDADSAVRLKPDAAQAFDVRGHVLEALGRRGEAVADFRRALAIEPRLQGSRDALKRRRGHALMQGSQALDNGAAKRGPARPLAGRAGARGISPDGCGVDAETECPQYARAAGARARVL